MACDRVNLQDIASVNTTCSQGVSRQYSLLRVQIQVPISTSMGLEPARTVIQRPTMIRSVSQMSKHDIPTMASE
ncbi:hypothetical protein M378DRAFT_166874 [Amanita muscaria Koide BX008]|uniref:Uncharacterized protein n=1 Tax=Amanita muscaria (strain Koide BX008) TaxID=946122 RepID=A0A0C2WIR8_AMAMK|nr:hypothetical protein M378DRAFT_166874 [Amanita muscaria Koide BX008]